MANQASIVEQPESSLHVSFPWPQLPQREPRAHKKRGSRAHISLVSADPGHTASGSGSQGFGQLSLAAKDFISSCNLITRSGKFNFLGCRIQMPSAFNIPIIEQMLQCYHDRQVVQFLEFGWPINYAGDNPPFGPVENHNGAKDFPEFIESKIRSEVSRLRVIGPCDDSSFVEPIWISPVNSVEKGTSDRRFIVDMSFPEGGSLNDGIEKDSYLGEPIELKLPTIDDFTAIIESKGQGCLLFKRDLKQAYRQIPVDGGDVHKLGYIWDGHVFVDRVLPMGMRSSCYICQRTTNIVTYVLTNMGYSVVNYIDDFAGVEVPCNARNAFEALGLVLESMGFEESAEKACPPSPRMCFLGILCDTEKMTLEVTAERLAEIKTLVYFWLFETYISRKQLESLIGKLAFVAKCVRPGRVFQSRLLEFLSGLPRRGKVLLTDDCRKDLRWWHRFLEQFNGVRMIPLGPWSQVDQVVASDACLTGCGALCVPQFFHALFPEAIVALRLHINELELLTLAVALKVWAPLLRGKRVKLHCDNQVSVEVLTHGRSKNKFLLACLREVMWVTACFEFEICAVHIPGVENRLPDCLSRWDKMSQEFLDRTMHLKLSEVEVPQELFAFSCDW